MLALNALQQNCYNKEMSMNGVGKRCPAVQMDLILQTGVALLTQMACRLNSCVNSDHFWFEHKNTNDESLQQTQIIAPLEIFYNLHLETKFKQTPDDLVQPMNCIHLKKESGALQL